METLPWKSCNNTWNAVGNCSSGFPGNDTHLQSASQQFFEWEDITSLQLTLYGTFVLYKQCSLKSCCVLLKVTENRH